MSEVLVRLCIKDYGNTKNEAVREKYGLLSGVVGIIVNLILTCAKFFIGTVSHSIAITGDALNNLSDAGSCIVTLAGFKMSSLKPDKEHPFGHGRLEYVAALIVGFLVEMMGFELIKSSIDKIRNPQPVLFSIPAVIVLLLSIGGKLWLALFNRHLGKKINSPALTAVVKDSIGDITATSFTLLALILSRFTTLPLDGFFGIAVALFIMYSGYGILKETIGIILGTPPSKELVDELVVFIMSQPGVMGIHDLMIHSYGESRMFASVHIEILASEDILKAHDVIDLIEKQVLERFGIQLVAHLDPLIVDDRRINDLRDMTEKAVKEMDESFKIHDFRVVEGPTHTNLIFDMVVPFDCKRSEKELKETLEEKIKAVNDSYFVVATVEGSYT